ncbi:hypothetical protein GGI25_002365 [Coemansia spiralis]|uniref:Endonuclease/exonuclease/phosphatase domain-containing protein n=2 Tax=Coemansia TaxID=4863 RepID=A0A9W8G3U7_9FUNG|nr:hypothetical protein EDC05_004289 [Coemansia umbellata]KAJ2622170.1 hypothetical protein GGI26_003465 [Coemansia sp. RSA 1358]KAJ2678380.1 hypothetical protein GGI25_002365 [Coemansia spiralis]
MAELLRRDNQELGVPIVIIGDLNSRLGNTTGDRASNKRGRALQAHLEGMQAEIINNRLSAPQYTFNGRGSSIIELIIVEEPANRLISDFWVVKTNSQDETRNMTSMMSDHNALGCEIQLPSATTQLAKKRLRIERLQTAEGPHKNYNQLLASGLVEWTKGTDSLVLRNPMAMTATEATAELDKCNNEFCRIIRDELEKSVGRTRAPKAGRPLWWTRRISTLRNRMITGYQHYRATAERDQHHNLIEMRCAFEDYLQAQEDFHSACKQAALNWWRTKQQQLTSGKAATLMKHSRSIRAKKGGISPTGIVDEQLRPVDAVAKHFSEVLNYNATDLEIDSKEREQHLSQVHSSPITEEAVRRAIKRCGANKASDLDELQVEAFTASKVAQKALAKMIQACWHLSHATGMEQVASDTNL